MFPLVGSNTLTIIFTKDFGVKNTPSSCATFLANLFRKYSYMHPIMFHRRHQERCY